MEIGDVINGYTVITPIGQGGAGIVYDVQKGAAHYALKECTITALPARECTFIKVEK